VDLAFKSFFRRVKNGEKAGYPRYKSKTRYNSITFPQAPSGCQIKGNHLVVSKVGKIKIKRHRDLVGNPKTAIIKKSATGKWCVIFTCEIEDLNIQVPQTNPIGIDVGIENFAHFSNNTKIENPKFFKKEEKELAKSQRKLSKQPKGTKERQKAKKVVARIYERISFKRKNFAHQQSRKIVDLFNPIFIEDLSINNMRHNSHRCMNKAISDAAWSMFFNFLQYKAEEAGVVCRRVNPSYTSQNCSDCGHRNSLKLSDRLFKCTCCNFETTRDHNAAINIKTLGLQGLANSLEANVL
jgi:putative transposase